jgi:hypothetical protein
MAKQQINQSQAQGTTLGYQQITSNQSTTSTTAVVIPGLTVGVTVPAGGRRVKITVFARDAYNSTAQPAAGNVIAIYSGASANALTTQIGGQQVNIPYGTSTVVNCSATQIPSAGTIYYTVAFYTTNAADAFNVEAGAAYPAFILVELI